MKPGDKLKCSKTVYQLMDKPMFIEGNVYEVLDINGREITLNHILYANEYQEFDIDFINEKFKKI